MERIINKQGQWIILWAIFMIYFQMVIFSQRNFVGNTVDLDRWHSGYDLKLLNAGLFDIDDEEKNLKY